MNNKKQKYSCKKYFLLLVFAISFLAIASCGFRKDKIDPNNSEPAQAQFASIQSKILTKKCISCHNPQNLRGGVDLTEYSKIMSAKSPQLIVPGAPTQSLFYQVIANGSMPKDSPRLSKAELSSIYNWILAGAPEFPNQAPIPIPTIPSPVIPEIVDYTHLLDAILKPRCLRCHSESCTPPETCKIEGFVDLSSYNEIMDNIFVSDLIKAGDAQNSKLFIAVDTADMPRPKQSDRSNRISQEEIEYLKLWINEGAKEHAE